MPVLEAFALVGADLDAETTTAGIQTGLAAARLKVPDVFLQGVETENGKNRTLSSADMRAAKIMNTRDDYVVADGHCCAVCLTRSISIFLVRTR